jgi:UDP-N-acetylglucosamine:LPS N-acetylglucosamine transferase
VVPREGFPLDLIRVAGLKGKSRLDRLRGLLLLPLAALDAWRVISRRRPSVVVGVGGFSSGPVLALAALAATRRCCSSRTRARPHQPAAGAPVVRAAAVNFDRRRCGSFRAPASWPATRCAPSSSGRRHRRP